MNEIFVLVETRMCSTNLKLSRFVELEVKINYSYHTVK